MSSPLAKQIHSTKFFGFNSISHPSGNTVKTILDQIKFYDFWLGLIKNLGYDPSRIVLRPRGGNASLHWTEQIWANPTVAAPIIAGYAALQQKYGVKLINVIDYNRNPSLEVALFQTLEAGGMNHIANEGSNELYLFPFKNGDTSKPGVTERTSNMTPVKYTTMTDEYRAAFEPVTSIIYLVQLAPEGKGTTNQKAWYKAWNDVIVNYVNTSVGELGVTQHIYDENNTYNIATTKALRARFTHHVPFYFTEYGARPIEGEFTPANELKQALRERDLTAKILEVMQNGDVLLSHLLWTDYKGPGLYQGWWHNNTLMEKGKILMEYLFPEKVATEPVETKPAPGTTYFRKLNIKQPKNLNVIVILVVAAAAAIIITSVK
jgi:hypothetical protein